MWTHFESIHITMQPTYQSMYFPGQGLVLAASTVVFGHPWVGLLIVSALMCAALCWMLQAWLPPNWALLGGLLAVLRLGVFSYWTNTYHAAGSLAALGGALILGALPRLMRTSRYRYAMLIGIGIAILVLTRPYEGILLCLPVVFVLGRWMWKGKNRPSAAMFARLAAAPLAMTIAAGAWMGYYDYRAFGSPLTPPYAVDRATYGIAPYYVWQHARPEPNYRYAEMREFYHKGELDFFKEIHSLGGFLPQSLVKVGFMLLFYSGFALAVPLSHGAARVSGSAHPVSGGERAHPGGGNGDRDLSSAALCGPFHRGLLCDRLADDAPPAVVEAGGKARRAGDGAVDGDGLRTHGLLAGLCRTPAYCPKRMAAERLELHVVWSAAFWNGASADRSVARPAAWRSTGYRPLLGESLSIRRMGI